MRFGYIFLAEFVWGLFSAPFTRALPEPIFGSYLCSILFIKEASASMNKFCRKRMFSQGSSIRDI
jgi:hypothetical protein